MGWGIYLLLGILLSGMLALLFRAGHLPTPGEFAFARRRAMDSWRAGSPGAAVASARRRAGSGFTGPTRRGAAPGLGYTGAV